MGLSNCLTLYNSIDKHVYRTRPAFRTVRNITNHVRCWSLLTNLLNSWLRQVIYPAQVLVTRSVQIAVFVLVRHHQYINVFNKLGLLLYIVTFGGGTLGLMGLGG